MNIDDFRSALSQFATGVTVVTTPAVDDRPPAGFTASAFTSVSLHPPLVLVCLAETAQSFAAFSAATYMGVSILGQDQKDLAMRFADSKADKFEAGTTLSDFHNLPLVDGALAHLCCRISDRIVEGDHAILVGEVQRASANSRPPLIYWDRDFRSLGDVRPKSP